MNCTEETISFWEKGNVNSRVLKPQQMMYYTWVDPAGERIITWKNVGKSNIENDLRRDGVDQFVVAVDENEASTSTRRGSKGRRSSQMETFFWVSFLDGTQRVLMFTKNPTVANSTQSSSRLDQVCAA